MALSKETAGRIIDIVAADANCRKAIRPYPVLDFLNPGTSLLLEFSHLAGGIRNFAMILQGKGAGDPTFDERACYGIAAATQNAIYAAIRQGKLPGVRTAGIAHRVHRKVHHQATSIDMNDSSVYIFDWHATLKVQDPVISKFKDWENGQNAINYVLFSGFN